MFAYQCGSLCGVRVTKTISAFSFSAPSSAGPTRTPGSTPADAGRGLGFGAVTGVAGVGFSLADTEGGRAGAGVTCAETDPDHPPHRTITPTHHAIAARIVAPSLITRST